MKKSLFFFSLFFLSFAALIQAQDISYNPNQATKPYGQLQLLDPSRIQLLILQAKQLLQGILFLVMLVVYIQITVISVLSI